MKKLLVLISALSHLSSSSASLIFPEKGLPTASEVKLTKVEKQNEAHNINGFRTMNIKIFGTAVFSNACKAPDSFVKERLESDLYHVRIRVLSVYNRDKTCPMVYRPVEKTFLIDTIGTTDIMPTIEVNGQTL